MCSFLLGSSLLDNLRLLGSLWSGTQCEQQGEQPSPKDSPEVHGQGGVKMEKEDLAGVLEGITTSGFIYGQII